MRFRIPIALLVAAAGCAGTRSMEHLNAPGRTDTAPFSHGVLAGDFYFVAGTLGLDPSTGQAPADPADEVRFLLEDFRKKLALAGLDMDDLVSVQVFCSDVSLYDTFNGLYRACFTGGFPARAFLGSGPLLKGCRFEITGIALRR